MDPTLVPLVAVLALSLAWHEAAHAWVADRLGDSTARRLGRVTLNPLKHLDPFLSVILPAIMYYSFGVMFGGGKPVPVDVRQFRHPARDFMFVALAGPFSNLALAVVFAALFVVCAVTGLLSPLVIPDPFVAAGERVFPVRLPMLENLGGFVSEQGVLGFTLAAGVALNVLLAVFNLIPLPPLDGSRVVGWLLPRQLQVTWYRLDRIGLVLVLVFFFYLGGLKWVFAIFRPVYNLYVDVADQVVKMVMAT